MPFVICLTHSKSDYFPQTTKCRFLTEGQPNGERPLGEARCGIYESRPSACRAFPTKLNEAGDRAILYDVPERGRTADDQVYDLCPRQWEADDFNQVEAVRNLATAKFEMSVFHLLADHWNRDPQSWSVFPDFLRLVYSNPKMIEAERRARRVAASTVSLPDFDDRSRRKVA